MTPPQESDRRRLVVAVDLWIGAVDGGEEAPADVELVDVDEVKLEARGGQTVGLYMSRAAAAELGEQLVDASREKWGRS